MVYRVTAFPMTLRDLQGHSPIVSLFECYFVRLCSSWQEFNWHSASRGISAIAEPSLLLTRAQQ